MTRARFIAFAAAPSIVAAIGFCAAYWWLGLHKTPEERGKELNQRAWEACFSERGLSIPTAGPRDGWHSDKLFPKSTNALLEWTEREQHLPGLLDVDSQGMQHWTSKDLPRARLLIVGASVAFGIYASSIDTTYFDVAGRELQRRGTPVQIDVLAAGAWKSSQERTALMLHQYDARFDLVVLINGLNDFCLGATPEHTFFSSSNQQYQTPDRAFADDYEARLEKYLGNLRADADICRARGFPMLVVLQPGIFEKAHPSALERQILATTFDPKVSPAEIVATYRKYYESIRTAVNGMATTPNVFFFDASRTFSEETATTFSDFWHFADPGHALFGKALAQEVAKILEQTMRTHDETR